MLVVIITSLWVPDKSAGIRQALLLQILVLENVRFYKEETKNDPGFAQKVGPHQVLSSSKTFCYRHRLMLL